MKQEKIALKTMGIKARVYNFIRKSLYNKRLEDLSQDDKNQLFNQIFTMNSEAHGELNGYKNKRQYKKAIYQARIARGYKFKKKQSSEEVKKYLENRQ